MKLSKSSYCSGIQCEKILWLMRHGPECPEDKTVFETGRQVGELAKGLFGDYEEVPADIDFSRRLEKTEELLCEKPNVIAEASFTYNDNFCSVDILKNDSDGVEIYEVKSSTKIRDVYIDDASYQYFVLSNLGLNVKKVAIVNINNKYVRCGDLELDRLFSINDITDIAREKQDEIRDNIDRINTFMQAYGSDSEPEMEIGNQCFSPYKCRFWDHCTRNLPKPNVFDIKGGMQTRTKLKKYYEGKISFKDLENEDLNPKYLEQIDFELNDREPKINRKAINEILDSLVYPLYFIDYEACQFAIPEFEGTKPYQQIPFQYSLHIVDHPGSSVEHKEFLAQADDENLIRSFAESMIRDLPENGSVIVYNRAFEATRNREIGKMFPDLKDEMDRINANIVDLMVPFKNRDYYTKEMHGSFSIKYVLPALYPDDPELDYSNLELVHRGDEAANAFVGLKDKTPAEQEEIRKALLKYCRLDTLAMVKIWEKFVEVSDR